MTAFTRSHSGRRPRTAAGFSLIELAVGIAIITLLLGSLMVPLQSQVESRKISETQKILDNAREALMGYAAAYGYFPCPADSSSNGAEAATSSHATPGSCPTSVTGTNNVYAGYLPAATLGFTPVDANGYAVDAWGGTGTQNRIRYAISGQNVGSATRAFVSGPNATNGMKGAGMSNIMSAALLNVCSAAPSSPSPTACNPTSTTLTSNAIAVIWSLGANATTTGGTSTHEAANVKAIASADRVWVMRDKSTQTATEFDDMVVWISTPLLFSRLLTAGQLP